MELVSVMEITGVSDEKIRRRTMEAEINYGIPRL
jgi:hypothetical protein